MSALKSVFRGKADMAGKAGPRLLMTHQRHRPAFMLQWLMDEKPPRARMLATTAAPA